MSRNVCYPYRRTTIFPSEIKLTWSRGLIMYSQVESMSPGVLSAAVQDIDSVVNMVDKIAGGLAEGHSQAAIGEDLVSETRFRVQEMNLAYQQSSIYEREMEQKFSAMTWDTVGQPMHRKSDFDSTTTPKLNNLRIKVCNVLVLLYSVFLI